MNPQIRQATASDAAGILDILKEASLWLEQRGIPMWKDNELSAGQIGTDIGNGLFFVGECEGSLACIFKFQLEDALFWPEIPAGQSAFLHRFAVRRHFAGSGLSAAVLTWSAQRTRALGRSYLRLDCEAARPKLRAVYERFGFTHHSDKQVGPYFVSRYEFDVSKLAA